MSIKLGIIGAGAIGRAHLQAAKNAGVEVTCVADVAGDSARAAAASFGIARSTDKPAELLASPDVDAVVICVPNKFHAPLSIDAMKAGKDVLVEKPMAMSAAECRRMIDAAAKNKRILQVAFRQRFTSVARTARQFIEAGRLGQIYHAKTNYYRRRGVPGLGGWFTTKSLSGGGPLIDLGVHIIDLALYLMNSPRPLRVSGKVYAKFGCRMKDYLYEGMWAGPPRLEGVCDVEDSAHALVRLEGGTTLEINATWAGNFPENSVQNLIGFFGDKGGMAFQLGGKELRIATEDNGHNVDITPLLRPSADLEEQMRHFVANVQNRTQPGPDGQAGRMVQAVIDAIYESSAKDREVEVKL